MIENEREMVEEFIKSFQVHGTQKQMHKKEEVSMNLLAQERCHH